MKTGNRIGAARAASVLFALTATVSLAPAQYDLERARTLMAEGRVDEALLVTDSLLEREPKNREALLLAADGNLRLVEISAANATFYLEDAGSLLERALRLENADASAWLKLADVRLKQSRFDDGARAARKAIEILDETDAPPAQRAAARIALADNEMQTFVDARRTEMAEEESEPRKRTMKLADKVLLSCNEAFELGSVAPAVRTSAMVYQWLDKPDEAIRIYEKGLGSAPDDVGIHTELQNLHLSMGRSLELVGTYKRLAREKDTALVTWFLGRALVAHGDSFRREGRHADAADAYLEAESTFETYAGRRPDHRASVDQWRAICRLGRARCAFELGDLTESEQLFHAAYEVCPAVAEYDANGYPAVYDTFGGNYLGGLFRVGQSMAEGGSIEAMQAALGLYERILERHPDRFGSAYNNAALTARDLGGLIARQRAGQPARGRADESKMTDAQREAWREAMDLWERSYRYYEKAVELNPGDERIVNDCGLMLVYHLHRDYDRARELFDRAIEIGQPKLDALPADASEQERNDVSEAVGDAWQNIGVMLQSQGRDAEAVPFYEKAVNYYPYERRAASRAAAEIRARLEGREQDPQAKKEAAFAPAEQKAEAAASDGDYDTALAVLDGCADEFGDLYRYRLLAARYNYALAQQQIAEGGNAGLISGLFQDALRNVRRAIEIDADGLGVDALLLHTQILLDTGDAEAALAEAESLLSHGRSTGGLPGSMTADTHRLRAIAATRVYTLAKQANEERGNVLDGARTSFRALEEAGALTADDRRTWTSLERWAGAVELALDVERRALTQDGDPQAFVDLAMSLGRSADAIEELAGREDALGMWWRGRARYARAMEILRERKFDDAAEALTKGREDFRAAGAENPEYEATSAEWAAYCLGAKGVTHAFANKDDAATDELLAAIGEHPPILGYDLGGWTPKQALDAMGARAVQDGLDAAVDYFRKVSDALPQDVDYANNLGLFARDYAAQLEGEKAREMYELSYAAYTRAQGLEPDNVRLCNDRALILVHYLDRDFDVAESLLERAVELGAKQFDRENPDQKLEEAIGDAYENLALLYIKQGKWAEARKAAETSLEYYPGASRPGARFHLRRIEAGERGGER
jgi:tetratricopeptide (TPR) repeat protein